MRLQKNEELEKKAWLEKNVRNTFLKKRRKFYANEYSDEIYKTIPGAKNLEETDIPLIYYVRTSYFAYPEDVDAAISEEFMNMLN